MTINHRIKTFRTYKGLTQDQTAEKLHISGKAYQNIENGTTKLDLERLKDLAIIFDVSIFDLIGNGESVFVNKIDNNQGGISNHSVTVNSTYVTSLVELYEKTLNEKNEEIIFLRKLVQDKKNLSNDNL